MHTIAIVDFQSRPRRSESSSSSGMGGIGCFVFLLIIGLVVFLVMRGRKDKQEQLGASHRPMGSGPVDAQNFTSPYPKCGNCGAPGDKMKSNWDGMRKIAWTCGYCSAQAGVQELKDEELPASARQRLGLDAPGVAPGQPGYMPNQGGGMGGMGGVGGLLTGMMIGGMMGGGGHRHNNDGSGSGGQGSSGSGGSDWGDSGGSSSGGDWGDSSGSDSSGGGSDWGDSGGDSGGGDSGGGDW